MGDERPTPAWLVRLVSAGAVLGALVALFVEYGSEDTVTFLVFAGGGAVIGAFAVGVLVFALGLVLGAAGTETAKDFGASLKRGGESVRSAWRFVTRSAPPGG